MEARRRGDVEVAVGVVHAVQAPEQGKAMRCPVLQVQRQVEGEDGRGKTQPGRRIELVEQAPAALCGQHRRPDHGERQQQAHRQRIDGKQGQVGEPAACARLRRLAERRGQLDQCQQHEHQRHRAKRQQRQILLPNVHPGLFAAGGVKAQGARPPSDCLCPASTYNDLVTTGAAA